ncbi:MAG: DUF2811 domain-containing protein [candidate division Zixibacteria bacterium]|nr:DUF2811 domain-containing protein [candidate division Zixibacteria bacterium]
MTFQNTSQTDPAVRPDRIKFLAEIPITVFRSIENDLRSVPDWDRHFIMSNPVAWPEGMFDVISKHLES